MQQDTRIQKNMLSGFAYQVVLMVMGFLLPRLYLDNFGSEVNGVLSTIKQIFGYLWLLEAGVGGATTQALYGPVGKKNHAACSGVLAATHVFYKKTGIIYTGIVLVIASVYAFVVPTPLAPHVVFAMVILMALPSLFSYFVQAKYRLLMEVDGRKYVITTSETVLHLVSNLGKILVLLLTDSLVLIQLVYCVLALVQLGYLYVYAKRNYAWLDPKAKPDFAAISQSNSVLVHQISGMVFSNTDILLLSFLCDFKVVSVYTIYNIFFTQAQNFITSVLSGFSYKHGQLYSDAREKFDRVYKGYEMLYTMVTFAVYTLMAVFLLPLVQIYTGGINDAEYTNATLVLLFVLSQLLSNGKLPSMQVLEFAGEFKNTRAHAICEMVLNLSLSVFGILKFGICGALVGTIAALIYRSVMSVYHANKKVLERSMWQTYKLWVINGAVFAVAMCVFYVDSFAGLSFSALVLKGLMHGSWILALFLLVNFIFNREAFRYLPEVFEK